MSGGHYNYDSGKLEQLAWMIRNDCEAYSSHGVDKYGFSTRLLEPEAIKAMQECATELEKVAKFAHAVEWYMSGDYGLDALIDASQKFQEAA